ncbi:MAG: hypothetical protein ACI8XM_002458 [Haloarculaceae archaeon]|jgi:hypothetical protein
MRLRDRLGISTRRQKQLSYLMELLLVGLLFIGIERGSTTIVVNTLVGLVVTQIPPVLERDYDVPMDPALTLWITSAVTLHAVGVVGLPGSEANFYGTIPGWDHVTHALSSSVVAAVGYATARALDIHSEDIYFPRRFMFVYILLFVLAFGVLWEVIEFSLGVAARTMGNTALLTQYGLEDSMLDLVFDTIGAVIVAVWGTAHLHDVSGYIAAALQTRSAD